MCCFSFLWSNWFILLRWTQEYSRRSVLLFVIVCVCVFFLFTKVCNRPFAEKLSHGTKTPRWKANDVVGIKKTKRLHHSKSSCPFFSRSLSVVCHPARLFLYSICNRFLCKGPLIWGVFSQTFASVSWRTQSWIYEPYFTSYTKKYPVPCVWACLLIQKYCRAFIHFASIA